MHADRHTSRWVYTMFWTLTIHHVKSVNVNWERGLSFLNLKENAEFNLVAIRAVQKKVLKAVKNGDTTINLVEEEESTEGLEPTQLEE